jgi:hypothetical protein
MNANLLIDEVLLRHHSGHSKTSLPSKVHLRSLHGVLADVDGTALACVRRLQFIVFRQRMDSSVQ